MACSYVTVNVDVNMFVWSYASIVPALYMYVFFVFYMNKLLMRMHLRLLFLLLLFSLYAKAKAQTLIITHTHTHLCQLKSWKCDLNPLGWASEESFMTAETKWLISGWGHANVSVYCTILFVADLPQTLEGVVIRRELPLRGDFLFKPNHHATFHFPLVRQRDGKFNRIDS